MRGVEGYVYAFLSTHLDTFHAHVSFFFCFYYFEIHARWCRRPFSLDELAGIPWRFHFSHQLPISNKKDQSPSNELMVQWRGRLLPDNLNSPRKYPKLLLIQRQMCALGPEMVKNTSFCLLSTRVRISSRRKAYVFFGLSVFSSICLVFCDLPSARIDVITHGGGGESDGYRTDAHHVRAHERKTIISLRPLK